MFCDCVLLAIKLAFPIVGIILVLDIGVGILMKIIPQINLFILDIPLKILLGIAMLLLMLSPMGDFLGNLVSDLSLIHI